MQEPDPASTRLVVVRYSPMTCSSPSSTSQPLAITILSSMCLLQQPASSAICKSAILSCRFRKRFIFFCCVVLLQSSQCDHWQFQFISFDICNPPADPSAPQLNATGLDQRWHQATHLLCCLIVRGMASALSRSARFCEVFGHRSLKMEQGIAELRT